MSELSLWWTSPTPFSRSLFTCGNASAILSSEGDIDMGESTFGLGLENTPKSRPADSRSLRTAAFTKDSVSSVSESARAITGSTLTRAERRRITRSSAGDIANSVEYSRSESSSWRSPKLEQEPVVSDRVLPGLGGWLRRDDDSINDGSTIKIHLSREI